MVIERKFTLLEDQYGYVVALAALDDLSAIS